MTTVLIEKQINDPLRTPRALLMAIHKCWIGMHLVYGTFFVKSKTVWDLSDKVVVLFIVTSAAFNVATHMVITNAFRMETAWRGLVDGYRDILKTLEEMHGEQSNDAGPGPSTEVH